MKYRSQSQSNFRLLAGKCRLSDTLSTSQCFHGFVFLLFLGHFFVPKIQSIQNPKTNPRSFFKETKEQAIAPCFNIICNDRNIVLPSGACYAIFDFLPDVQNICTTSVNVQPLDTNAYKFGQKLYPGWHQICFIATDVTGASETCCMNVTVSPVPNPNISLACLTEVQISLNENCYATITPQHILTGGPYRCFDDYFVELKDWYSNDLIDRDPNQPGVQLGKEDINRVYKVTIHDLIYGNSCWSKLTVEDKLPPKLICPPDTSVLCGYSTTGPDLMGIPTVIENCGSYTLTYFDDTEYGDCARSFQEIIHRNWIVTDEQGNKITCVQNITVLFVNITQVLLPEDYDDLDNPALLCDEKINPSFDAVPHYLDYPDCIDGTLLDSNHLLNTGERLPKLLGWNCIDSGLYVGHPSPFPVFYPVHPDWTSNNPNCWAENEVVMWLGTGLPNGGNCRNLNFSYTDLRIDLAKPECDAGSVGCYKVLRKWTIMDWCTGQVLFYNQIIKVIDNKPPSIIFVDSVLVNMEEFSCNGKWIVPKPWLTDNCSNDINYYVNTESGFVLGDDQAGYIITNIKPGIWNAYIIAEDCCGNISRMRFVINAQDNVPPTPVCDRVTAVSLIMNPNSGEDFAQIFAKDFDQASYDNCYPHLFYKVIRMEQLRGTINGSAISQVDNGQNCTGINGDDQLNANGNQIYFDDYVRFCCSDVGKTVRVVLRVFDREVPEGPVNPGRMANNGEFAGHFNDCMIDVEVQDKTIPTVQAPPDIVVSCWFWFDIDNIDDPFDATFGRVVTQMNQRKKVVTNDVVCYPYCNRNEITGYPGYIPGAPPSNPPASNKACEFYNVLFDTSHADRTYNLTWGFDGTVLGACGVNFSITVNDARECGQGRITRTIIARGPNGLLVTATQTIWVVDCDPFFINREDDCDPLDDITWPPNCTGQAIVINGCGGDVSPDNPILGRPKIENHADDLCALISTEYYDELFEVEHDACFKILRKWVIIDWCQYEPALSLVDGRWEYLQIIKVFDTQKPQIEITTGDCEIAFKRAVDNLCYAHINLEAAATDNCSATDWLRYEYKIDLYNDGKGTHSGFDYVVGPLSEKEQRAGKKPYRNDNPLAEDRNDPFRASGTYPLGIHKICWFVEDGCANYTTQCTLFEIKDCKHPTPYCHKGITTVVMPSTKCITIWARDLDAGSFDNCTENKDLRFYFAHNNSDSLTICCDDFVSNRVDDELAYPLVICIEDEEGNVDCCETFVLIQDPQDVCPNVGHNARISGVVETMTNTSTKNVKMQLLEYGNMKKELITGANGQFFFGDLPYGASVEYTLKPSRNDDHLNGVSTADIVKIQRHILGMEALPSPYQWIAADVNNSLSITAADITEIRKLILGSVSSFEKSESWTFVPKNATMDTKYPWKALRELKIPVPDAQMYSADFVSIKMGDVNNTVNAGNASGIHIRNEGILQFEIDSHQLVAGEVVKVEFKSRNFKDIFGYQFTLQFNVHDMHFENFEPGILPLNENNFGLQRKADGLITMSWNAKTAKHFDEHEILFTLIFRANQNASLEDCIAINSRITAAEAYDSHMNSKDVSLSIRNEFPTYATDMFALYQNTPNPFDKETMIHFVLPEALPAELILYDPSGKIIHSEILTGKKGWNSIRLKQETCNATSGIYYYQLNAGNYTATKRMTIINSR